MSWNHNFIHTDTAIAVIGAVSDATMVMSDPRAYMDHVLIKTLIEHGDRETLVKACLRTLYAHPWVSMAILGKLYPYPNEGPEFPEETHGNLSALVSIWIDWCKTELGEKVWQGQY